MLAYRATEEGAKRFAEAKKRYADSEKGKRTTQANRVATMVLNGQIDMESARTYASLTRNIAALWSAQVTRARFLREEPDLTFDEELLADG